MKEIELKKEEILHYEGVLERYGHGRWMDQGRRHLASLREELRQLESKPVEEALPERV